MQTIGISNRVPPNEVFILPFFGNICSNEHTCADEYLAESGDVEEDLALLHDIPSLPKLPWKLLLKELNGPGDAGDAVNGDFDLTEPVLDLKIHPSIIRDSIKYSNDYFQFS